jgi:hypothetical protein
MSKIIVAEVYARGNVGSRDISDEILEITEKVMEIWENEDFKSATKYVEKILNLNSEYYEFDEKYEYEINEKKEEILIYNRMIDKYGNSWGYEKVLIKNIAPKLIHDKENCLSWVEKDKQYFVEEIDTDEWVIDSLNETFKLENKYLTANKVKKIIETFFDYIEEHFKTWPINGVPIVSNNPYAYGYDGYGCEIKDDYLVILTESTCQLGAGYHLIKGHLILKKLKHEKESKNV